MSGLTFAVPPLRQWRAFCYSSGSIMASHERAHARLTALHDHLRHPTRPADSALARSPCKAAEQPQRDRDLFITADEAAALVTDGSCITVRPPCRSMLLTIHRCIPMGLQTIICTGADKLARCAHPLMALDFKLHQVW